MPRNRDFDYQSTIEKAQDLFWKKGYADTSMQDLVDHLGLGRSSLYNAFGNKEDLFLTVLESYYQKRTEAMRRIFTDEPAHTPIRESMRGFFQKIVEEIVNDLDQKGCLFVNTRTQKVSEREPVSALLNKSDKAQLAMFEERLKRARSDEKRDFKRDIKAIALFFSGTIKGLRVLAKSDFSREDLLEIVETALIVLDE